MRGFRVESEDVEIIYFGIGMYNKDTGLAEYTVNELPAILERFNRLHKKASNSALSPFTAILGFLLLFMAISSLCMFKTTSPHFKRGMILTVVGVLVSVVMLLF